jgi:hypothetical protein
MSWLSQAGKENGKFIVKLVRLWCLLLLLPTPPWAAGLGQYYGVWNGTLTEMVVAGKQYRRYAVTLTLSPNEYHIDYPSLGCGGSLRLLKYGERRLVFRDEMEYGLEQCANGGRTELRVIGPELYAFLWYDRKGVLRVEGYLKKQKQLMVLDTTAGMKRG